MMGYLAIELHGAQRQHGLHGRTDGNVWPSQRGLQGCPGQGVGLRSCRNLEATLLGRSISSRGPRNENVGMLGQVPGATVDVGPRETTIERVCSKRRNDAAARGVHGGQSLLAIVRAGQILRPIVHGRHGLPPCTNHRLHQLTKIARSLPGGPWPEWRDGRLSRELLRVCRTHDGKGSQAPIQPSTKPAPVMSNRNVMTPN